MVVLDSCNSSCIQNLLPLLRFCTPVLDSCNSSCIQNRVRVRQAEYPVLDSCNSSCIQNPRPHTFNYMDVLDSCNSSCIQNAAGGAISCYPARGETGNVVLDPGSGALSALMRCVDVADVDAFALSYVPGRNALPRSLLRHARGLHSLLRPRVLITKHTVLTAGQGKFSLPGCSYARSCCLARGYSDHSA